ncbi:hypothetical protein KIW84_063994 [Lathyrus oleraceus]|uniref:Transposase MuDR plant domain-containing protein n=1 Tax=Pisum sativum TaxID=3888 RepID=A0A9D4WBD5_PEA|nr:hypothetical protein KIW84_063994 [Pisum sativum]
MDMEHVIENDYMIDELDIGADEDSCDDMPIVIRFTEEETLKKDFIYKVGMEFSSLNQFKKVVLEHSVLNGREKHKYGRKFFNKNVNVDWVARVVVDMLKNNSTMKLNEVEADVRPRFATEITGCMAFKARQLARKVV